MTFFNKNEEVISIELTPHGRKLLSHGTLEPVYYSFFDDDILYESQRGGFSETNAQTKNRILNETPSLKPQHTYFGIDSNISNTKYLDDSRTLINEIGTNSRTDSSSPSWQINFLQGEISSSSGTMTSSKNTLLNIPQIECEINYTMSVDNEARYKRYPVKRNTTRTPPAPDGTFIEIKEQMILMDIFEKFGFDYKDSFEMEVFIYEHDGTQNRLSVCSNSNTEYSLKKLKFLKRERNIKNDLLLDDMIYDVGEIELDLLEQATPDNVEYYLNVSTDINVPKIDVCQSLHELKARNIFLDFEYDCSDIKEKQFLRNVNIYNSPVTPKDIEDCE